MRKIEFLKKGVGLLVLLLSSLALSGTFGGPSQVGAEPNVDAILLSGERIAQASLTTADFDGDGDKEIVAGGQDGKLYVVAYDGSSWMVVWERQTATDLNAAGPPNPIATTEIRAAPAVADLDGDGRMEIVVTTGGDPKYHKNGGVLVYTYDASWSFSVVSGWPQPKLDIVGLGPGASDPDGYWDGIWGSPALGDLDGDGDLEIAVEGFDRRLHAWHHDGTVVSGWPISHDNGDDLVRGGWSSPAIGDIDDDGLAEVVFGTDSPPLQDGSYNSNKSTLWAFNGDSSYVTGFPVLTDQTIQSSPALGDIDGDGVLEIVVGTGAGIPGTGGYKVYAWNGDGTVPSGWPRPTDGNMPAPPALGDLDGDGDLEIVIGCGIGDGNCQLLYAWHGDGAAVSGFPMRPVAFSPWQDFFHDPTYSPIMADYDGDGTTEIMMVVRGTWGISIVEPDGSVNPDRSRVTGAGQSSHGSIQAAPVVDDVDNDGLLETLVGTVDNSGDHGEIFIWDEVGSNNSALPWPTFHHDMRRTGNVWNADLTPPTNPALSAVGHSLGAWSNDNTVRIQFSGAADDQSGVGRFYYAWDNSPATAIDRSAGYLDGTAADVTSAPLADGKSHYFHLRTMDRAGNLAIDTVHLGPFWIDTQPPVSAVSSPPFAADSFAVSWQGSDGNLSGIASYDVQVRDGAGGTWMTWQDDVAPSTAQAVYTGTVGHTLYFRALARDVAGNEETPPDDGDTSTTVTAFTFLGHVYNSHEEPVFLAQVATAPSTMGEGTTDLEGAFGLFFNDAGVYQLTVQRGGFGSLPARTVSGGSLSGLDFYLPPADDLIADGHFELSAGTLPGSAWTLGGSSAPTLTDQAHTGAGALLMQGSGTSVVSQTLTLPTDPDTDELTLSWMALVTGTVASQDVLTVEVSIGGIPHVTAVSLSEMTTGEWEHGYWVVSAQTGQPATVRLALDAVSDLALRLDEVSLGKTRPGLYQIFLPLVLRGATN